MEISDIDIDFKNIINYLNRNGFKPYASCDGVIKNHPIDEPPSYAYIGFLKSEKIIDLMAAFLRDNDIFTVNFSNSTYMKPYYLYGNLIDGNKYSVNFYNKKGDITAYFEKIIIQLIKGKITISDEEKRKLKLLSEVMEEDEKSDLSFSVDLNSRYQPYMKKEGKINILNITTKQDCGYNRNMNELMNILSKKYGINIKSNNIDEIFDTDEFIISSYDNNICTFYFKDNDLSQIIDIIRYSREKQNELSKFELKESNFDYELDENEFNL